MCIVFFTDFFFQFMHLEQLFLLFSFLFVIFFLMSRFWWHISLPLKFIISWFIISALLMCYQISRLTQVQFLPCQNVIKISRQWLERCQFSLAAQSYPTLCEPMDCSMPGSPVHHQFLELTETHVIESVMPSNHLISCHPFLLPPSIFLSIRIFSSESALRIRWPKYWNFSFRISPSNEYSGLISFRIDWFTLLAVQGTLKSFLQPTVQNHQLFDAQLSL